MPRTSTAAVVQISQHKPYAPPMTHRVHITAPSLPACATDVRATIERVRGLLEAQATGRRKPRRVNAKPVQQADMFPSTIEERARRNARAARIADRITLVGCSQASLALLALSLTGGLAQ